MYQLTEAQMNGPTVESRRLQLQQHKALDHYYEVYSEARLRLGNDVEFITVLAQLDVLNARTAYNSTVIALLAMFGEDAPCHVVDADLWSTYSDAYKDSAGFRPRHDVSRAEVYTFLGRLHLSELQ